MLGRSATVPSTTSFTRVGRTAQLRSRDQHQPHDLRNGLRLQKIWEGEVSAWRGNNNVVVLPATIIWIRMAFDLTPTSNNRRLGISRVLGNISYGLVGRA